MSQQHVLYQWTKSVARQRAPLRPSQTKGLAAFRWGGAVARRCTLRVVAEALPVLGKPDTGERRPQRFVANPRLDGQAGARAVARWVVSGIAHRDGLVWLVDETSLQEHLKVRVMRVVYRGRALPVAWWCYRQEAWPLGRWQGGHAQPWLLLTNWPQACS